jgi:hypothetical protein
MAAWSYRQQSSGLSSPSPSSSSSTFENAIRSFSQARLARTLGEGGKEEKQKPDPTAEYNNVFRTRDPKGYLRERHRANLRRSTTRWSRLDGA